MEVNLDLASMAVYGNTGAMIQSLVSSEVVQHLHERKGCKSVFHETHALWKEKNTVGRLLRGPVTLGHVAIV